MKYDSSCGLENQAQALRYAALGHKVYPVYGIQDGKCLCRGTVRGCKPGKHPWGKAVPHGEKDATLDETLICQWFQTPAVNVGIGFDGSFVVLDFDVKSGGMETLAEWERKNGAMPLTPTVKTGGGGRHFVFKHPGVPLIAKPAQGVDCLWGNGGGWVVPPSLHASGNRYEWFVPFETPRSKMFPWLVEIVAEKPKPAVVRSGFDPMQGFVKADPSFADLGMLPAGERNDAVNSHIGKMAAAGVPQERTLEEGLAWAERQEPPYSADDMREKVRWVYAKREVEIAERDCPQNAPLHEGETGEAYSPFGHSPVRPSPSAVGGVPPTPIEPIEGEHHYGLLGDFVRAVEPLTEADPLGVLACLLCGVGNALGRGLHHRIGRRHGGNLFVLLIGDTSSRKGTCCDVGETLLSLVQPAWADGCMEHGFGSGQGLIYRIRDAQGDDEGVPDKRLMVVEEEFAKPLRLMRSESSILSTNLRSAYDGKPLAVMNKGENRYGVREPHVSIVGMITAEELLELLKGRNEMHNGFLNRFLLIGVKRCRYLASGADYGRVCRDFAPRLRQAVERAAQLRQPFAVADDAAAFWDGEYRRLEAERPGNYGRATARLSVHALKVAMLYAALDGENAIGLRHLRAALSLIAEADKTAFRLFGTANAVALGEEPTHSRLLTLIRSRSDGIIKTDAFRLFSNKRSAVEIDADLTHLMQTGFVRFDGGRYFANEPNGCGGVGGSISTPANGELANGEDADEPFDPEAFLAMLAPDALEAKEGL